MGLLHRDPRLCHLLRTHPPTQAHVLTIWPFEPWVVDRHLSTSTKWGTHPPILLCPLLHTTPSFMPEKETYLHTVICKSS